MLEELILKVANLTFVILFCPISLCNMVYKIVSKCLSLILKLVLKEVIYEAENVFLRVQNFLDKAIIGYECMNKLSNKNLFPFPLGYMGLKLGMSKAYDRVEWPFLDAIMNILGFFIA